MEWLFRQNQEFINFSYPFLWANLQALWQISFPMVTPTLITFVFPKEINTGLGNRGSQTGGSTPRPHAWSSKQSTTQVSILITFNTLDRFVAETRILHLWIDTHINVEQNWDTPLWFLVILQRRRHCRDNNHKEITRVPSKQTSISKWCCYCYINLVACVPIPNASCWIAKVCGACSAS